MFRQIYFAVHAVQYTRETREECIAFCDGKCRHQTPTSEGSLAETARLFIQNPRGEMFAQLGDWIVKHVSAQGSVHWVCSDAYFQTYFQPILEN